MHLTRPDTTFLKGKKLGEFWKYRAGDYRIIADIQDSELLILVVRIGSFREVLQAVHWRLLTFPQMAIDKI
ncbi:hypothetical protein Nhal_1262 [Nitrosococcus halophilus Nc 4]|uniref:Uncharacterized protein n=1 Tax=Nitrosococcus halophilus (strain Nc4) TaxID=472759 RepID=D5C094_NITHN|nr:type II toxin-antitoxin system RelE/ParE family toxin [Nitrosococcus halophilus]ADE14420.1 hypothetical protein Nhal_1262 [Nitrosococcus halophilus Nc 4]